MTLARLLRERRVSSRELVETLLKRIEAYNPTYNAVVTVDAERIAEVVGPLPTPKSGEAAT